MKIAIAADHGGYKLKEEIKPYIESLGHTVTDFGTYSEDSVDYPDYALPVAEAVASGEAEKGIIICGTGIGVSIVANKVPGVRAALCSDCFSAQATREHNDSNVLTFGERVIGPGLAVKIVDIWLNTPFSGDPRHMRRIEKITQAEKKYSK